MKSSKYILSGIVLSGAIVCLLAPARADWPNNNPTKWVQLPDQSPLGMDVKATVPKILADDFQCQFSGPISDIHIWGSWLSDVLPLIPGTTTRDPNAVTFKLSMHSDVRPAGAPSTPGTELWSMTFTTGQFKVVPWSTSSTGEFFYDPNAGQIIGGDTTIWQYNFSIPAGSEFVQTQGNIYWLDVQALPASSDAIFGWKTRDPNDGHFGDDAVWGDTPAFNTPPTGWTPLVYPVQHPLAGQSLDLAFALTTVPEPASMSLLAMGALLLMRRRR